MHFVDDQKRDAIWLIHDQSDNPEMAGVFGDEPLS